MQRRSNECILHRSRSRSPEKCTRCIAAAAPESRPRRRISPATEEAIQESSFQALFAEQTAQEMKQVLEWYKRKEFTTSQSESLRNNSLAQLYEDDECRNTWNELSCLDESYTSRGEFTAYQDIKESLPGLLSSVDSSSSWVDVPCEADAHEQVQEQCCAVDAACSKTRHMEEVLAELDDTSVEDEHSVISLDVCTLKDLPFVARLRVRLWCFARSNILQYQQRLWHALPPALVGTWLRVPRRMLLLFAILVWVVLTATLYSLPSTNTTSLQLVHYNSILEGRYWQSPVHYEVLSREWNNHDQYFECECIQEVLL